MKIDILTLFPNMFDGFLSESIIARGQKAGLFAIETHQLRDWATDKHGTVDDSPYGGGPGMVMKVDVIDRALHDLESKVKSQKSKLRRKTNKSSDSPYIILLTPQGIPFTQATAKELAKKSHIIFVAGHYEGFDERIRALVDEEISIGDYVLTGGELPVMVVTDAVVRLLPGVLGHETSPEEESFALSAELKELRITHDGLRINKRGKNTQYAIRNTQLLEYPHYTRPESYTPLSRPELGELTVPEILKSGHHAEIQKWRYTQALERTKQRRPDLLK